MKMIELYSYTEKEKEEILNSIVIQIDKREKKIDHIVQMFDKNNIPYLKKSLRTSFNSSSLMQSNFLNFIS
jgi:predicted MarR family transcription regulator